MHAQQLEGDLSVRQIAQLAKVKTDTVRRWISTGELGSWNAGGGEKIPRYRVSREAWEAFKKRRSGGPPRTRKPRNKQASQVTEFY